MKGRGRNRRKRKNPRRRRNKKSMGKDMEMKSKPAGREAHLLSCTASNPPHTFFFLFPAVTRLKRGIILGLFLMRYGFVQSTWGQDLPIVSRMCVNHFINHQRPPRPAPPGGG
jgi:hypothetical protein